MSYVKTGWVNGPNTATPIAADRLNNLETQHDAALAQVAADIPNGSSPIGTQLNATIGRRDNQTVVILGTSITEQNGILVAPGDTWPVPTDVKFSRATGYWTMANIRLGHRWKLLRNAGVPTSPFQAIRDRIPTLVAPYSPGLVIVEGGPGDMGSTASAITATLQGIYEDLLALGSRVVATTIMPCAYADTPTKLEMLYNVNTWIRNYATVTPGVILCDWHSVLADPATGYMLAGYSLSGDGVHPNAAGAGLLAKVLADALAPITAGTRALPSSNLDASVLTPNPMLVGTAGNIGGATGVAPTNWTIASPDTLGTVVVSKVSRVLDGEPFEWTQIERSSAGEVWMMTTDTTPPIGAAVYAACEFELDTDFANPSGLASPTEFALHVFFEGTPVSVSELRGGNDPLSETVLLPRSGVLRTPQVDVPAGCTGVTIVVAFGATAGKLRVARAGVVYA